MAKFINLTNHPSATWGEAQRAAVTALGCDEIIDIQFPNVNPHATSSDVAAHAAATLAEVVALGLGDGVHRGAVHVMGESGFVAAFVAAAKLAGVHCVHSTTVRVAVETKNADGTVTKTSQFNFVQFRDY